MIKLLHEKQGALKPVATLAMHPYGYLNMTTTRREIIVIRVRGQKLERSMDKSVRECVATWDSLEWLRGRSGKQYATLDLLAGQFLRIDSDWEIDGPTRVVIMFNEESNHTKVKYQRLPRDKFDIDNPLEYPCSNCGARRHEPCVGNSWVCTFRVFMIEGGTL